MTRLLVTPIVSATIDGRTGAVTIDGERGHGLRNKTCVCQACGELGHNSRRHREGRT